MIAENAESRDAKRGERGFSHGYGRLLHHQKTRSVSLGRKETTQERTMLVTLFEWPQVVLAQTSTNK